MDKSLKERIERVWKTGEHMVNKHEFTDYMLSLFEEMGESLIGGFERTSGTTVPIKVILTKKVRNNLRSEQRIKLKELLGK